MKRCSILLLLIATPAFADEATETSTTKSAEREPKGSFQVGAGVNSDDGFVARTVVAHDDLFGTGQHLSLQGDLSVRHQRFVVAHRVPDFLGTGLTLDNQLFTHRREYAGFTRNSIGGEVMLSKRLGAFRAYGKYRVERALAELPETMRVANPGQLGNGVLATLGGGLEYSTLDQPIFPLSGTRVHLWAERADRKWGSEYDLDRRGVDVDHARPLGPFTLRLRGSATQVIDRSGMGVPLAHRLFHDGHRDVRGYAFDRSTLFGDTTEANGSVELELPIVKKWGLSVAGFADAGWRDGGMSGSLIQRSVGGSLIWRSPIGVLRLDIAVPLDGGKPQFLFGIGGQF